MEQPSPTQPNNPNNNNFNTTTASTTTFGHRRAAKNPALESKLEQMALKLAPLVQLTTGAVHPAFPRNLLAFWLLTDEQLEALAHFYHQRTPCCWTAQYPCPVSWPPGLALEEKRRKLGKFMGLRGCDTPPPLPIARVVGDGVARRLGRTEEEICEDARRARLGGGGAGDGRGRGEDEVDEVRRKMGWY